MKHIVADVIGICHACGRELSQADRPKGYMLALIHSPLEGDLIDADGNTGCSAFDELDTPESYLVYMAKCQEATHRRRMS